MRCDYCFYNDVGSHREFSSYGIMSRETAEKITNNLKEDLNEGDEITIAFQGGEPTLAGLNWFKNFTALMSTDKKIKINYAIQTNGLLIDDEWAKFLAENKYLTGLSVDAVQKIHDSVRKNPQGEGTYEKCLQCKAALEKHSAEYNVLCVLTNELAPFPDKVWNFIKREKIRFIQFIPCLGSLDENVKSPFALTPPRFASFYSGIYHLWMNELESGSYISVKLFDDIANLFLRGVSSSCGINGRCNLQYVVESDGSVFPCDFYVLDKYNAGNLAEKTLREIFNSPVMQSFLKEERTLPPLCSSCSYFKLCGGGCKRMEKAMYAGASLCGLKTLLDKCLKSLEYTVRRHFR